MRALLMTAPGRAEVGEVPAPRAHGGEVVVEVERAGVCGTDVELFHGSLAYIADGATRYPIRPGHEWCGRVRALGAGVDRGWLGRRVVGDTMLGCGRCARCRAGRHHVCADRTEIGVRGDQPGALAERLALPASALHPIPEELTPAAGALVEPGGGALRAVRAAHLEGGERVLVLGAGTIGLLAAAFAAVHGASVVVADPRPEALALAARFGAEGVDPADLTEESAFRAVIDASTGAPSPAAAVRLAEPAGHVVLIGLAATPSTLDSRDLVYKDLRVTAVLGASSGLEGAIAWYTAGEVVPDPLVAAVVGLDGVPAVLAGERPAGAGPGPKVHVDPHRRA
ncbi:2-desacetyl-2-hydroxyethyl bacteriochlorophyllide A dehydrogenase [Friedmanniella luteola]|uniref:2-desacetyl-2-hydroxyethyl bacteriochlorophyllide A dehydrogenase n=1 Tax=Friedmanniella luteola TaxID=546871 RepID=A0A1H1NJN0_9ACTN|nr:alcohol dehydrogenase catalytic domain-containing protein [Friedmanniella luteola]SDR99204.1 2-desacetyl-2-hydroxyethyl bacteriochlorophyllide A dehydrogenase [Friedmanniella luteola]